MKKSILLLAIAMSSIASHSQEKLEIDTKKSEAKWFGEYVFFFNGHEGTIDFKDGYFIKDGDKISGGEFTIDMNSIKNTDIKNPKGNAGLVKHLKDEDFFNVVEHPTSKLVITEVFYEDTTHIFFRADLTIKGITLPIKFQAEVDFEKKQLLAKFRIDRMRWNVKYTGDRRDNAISDAIGFHIKLSI